MLEGLTIEQRKELLKALPFEERLRGFSAEEIRTYLKKINGEPASGETS